MNKIIGIILMTVYAVNVQAQFSGKGSGTEKDPYQITNADQLFDVRNDMEAYYRVMNDIDLGAWIQEDNPNQGWTPIGNDQAPFVGTFDGNRKVIIGLYISHKNMDFQGLFGCCQNATIKNVCLLNPIVYGRNNVGAVLGGLIVPSENTNGIRNNVVIGGTVEGDEQVGGIVGSVVYKDKNSSVHSDYTVSYNSSSSKVTGTKSVGGIIGKMDGYSYYNSWTKGQYFGSAHAIGNAFYGKMKGDQNVGGIVGTNGAMGSSTIESNIFGGTIEGKTRTNGLCGYINTANYNKVYKNVCFADTIKSNEEIKRFSTVEGSDNYAFAGTVTIINNRAVSLDDDNYNGTSVGLKTLRRKNTYTGLGFDFVYQWNIVEGETVPFYISQTLPCEVTSFVAGSRGKINGTADSSGKVYVFVGDKVYDSFVVDRQWEVTLGNVIVGTEAKVCVATGGLMPSLFVTAKAENSSSTATRTIGDANGDGVVDSADVTAIINYILGKPSSSFNKENADVTGDGEILIDDAVQTVQLIMDAQ